MKQAALILPLLLSASLGADTSTNNNNPSNPSTSTSNQTKKLNTTYVIPPTKLTSILAQQPFLTSTQNDPSHSTFVVDVVSIASQTRLSYPKAQIDTWAEHVSIRHLWGFTESEDYDEDCSSMTKEELQKHVASWEYQVWVRLASEH